MAARQPLLTFLPLACSLISLILVLLVLLAGTNNALSSLYYLKTDVSSLNVPPKLSSSSFLQDLTAISHKDLVGQPSTAASLGLADTYTLQLLTSCAHFSSGAVSCTRPSIGFSFDPRSELRLDSTSLQGTYPQPFLDALAHHRKATRSIAAAYILAALLTVLAPAAALFARNSRGGSRAAGILAATLGVLSAVLLLAASIAAVVVTKNLSAQFNDALGDSGLSSSVGSRPAALDFVATVLAVVTAAIFVLRARDDGTGGGGGAYITGTGADGMGRTAAKKKGGLLGFIPGLGRHRYVPLEKQLLARAAPPAGHEEGVMFDSSGRGAGRRGLGDEWAAVDEYSGGQAGGIQMKAVGGATARQADAGYEPYSHSSH